jgi:hypothetical protein
MSLASLTQLPISTTQVATMLKYVDVNRDGVISYEEFFGAFKVVDPVLSLRLEQKKRADFERGNSGTNSYC